MRNPFMLRSTHEAVKRTNIRYKARIECLESDLAASRELNERLVAMTKEPFVAEYTGAVKTLEQQLEEVTAAIQMVGDSHPLVTKDRHKKRRDLDRLTQERRDLLDRIMQGRAPAAEIIQEKHLTNLGSAK